MTLKHRDTLGRAMQRCGSNAACKRESCKYAAPSRCAVRGGAGVPHCRMGPWGVPQWAVNTVSTRCRFAHSANRAPLAAAIEQNSFTLLRDISTHHSPALLLHSLEALHLAPHASCTLRHHHLY